MSVACSRDVSISSKNPDDDGLIVAVDVSGLVLPLRWLTAFSLVASALPPKYRFSPLIAPPRKSSIVPSFAGVAAVLPGSSKNMPPTLLPTKHSEHTQINSLMLILITSAAQNLLSRATAVSCMAQMSNAWHRH